jgi:PAS domain S-box-containing protein
MVSLKQSFESLLSEKHLLCDLSIALSAVNSATDLPVLLTEQLQKLTRSSLLTFLEYQEENRCLVPVHVFAEHKTVQKITTELKEKFLHNGLFVPHETYKNLVSHGIGISPTLHELSFGIIPKAIEQSIQSSRLFDRYYWMAFSVSDKLYGASFFGFQPHQPDPSRELLHFFSWIAAVAMRRKKEEPDRILETLRESEKELRIAEYRFRALIENAPDGIVLISEAGNFKYISPSAKKMFHYDLQEQVKYHPEEMTHPEDLPMVHQCLTKLMADRSYTPVIEYRFRASDGTWRWIESTFTNLLAEPAIESIVINFRDIHDRKMAEEELNLVNQSLEKRVADRTAELTAANKELEAFAYTISHDLRAPVRAIGGFTKILEEDYFPDLEEEGRRIFRVITENTQKMEHLIDDLLSFSRLSRSDMSLSTTSMGEIIWQCFNELTTDEARTKITLKVTDLPVVRGDHAMLTQVWTNLLSNAIKYTSHVENPIILIECQRMNHELVFSIKDNGTGFDMKYANKLFGVFQRLHNLTEYEGTGVGLAIVQRIIQRHGGRIWAEAEVNKGARFYFTIKDSC